MRAISPAVRIPYVARVDRDRPPPEQTTWYLKPLTVRELIQLRTLDASRDWLAPNLQALDVGLIGWTGLKGADGHDVPFERRPPGSPADQPFLDHIDHGIAAELAAAIVEASTVSGDDAGKSSTPSASPSGATA